jgi:hypothetical protein
MKGSTAPGFSEAYGARLDAKFGGADGPACCLNAVMFTLMVEEPTFDAAAVIDKSAVMSPTSGYTAKSRMVMGTLQLCNAKVDACNAVGGL